MDAQNGSSNINIGTGRGQKAVGKQDDAALGEKLWLGGVKSGGRGCAAGSRLLVAGFRSSRKEAKGQLKLGLVS